MTGDSGSTTSSRAPWLDDSDGEVPEALHLVIAWSSTPGRLAESACVDRESILGRGAARASDPAPRLRFSRQRPGDTVAMGLLEPPRLSRIQLLLKPSTDALEVESCGRCPLLHNGRQVERVSARVGDVLTLVDALTLVVERRAKVMPVSTSVGYAAFAFGAADQFGMVGESVASWALRTQLSRLSGHAEPLLVLGESGTGKELAVQSLHGLSPRNSGALVARNATTLPHSLLDAELFGNIRNYPNAGSPERPGLIGQAHRGTLFLDEIGELPVEQQAHLLRFLDHGEYQRLGEAKVRRADVRFVGATNAPLEALKHDFLARFTHRVRVPGFRERLGDVALLTAAIVRQAAAQRHEYQRFIDESVNPSEPRVHPRFMGRLLRHSYTHHYRELQRLLLLSLETSPGNFLTDSPAVVSELSESSAPRPPDSLTKEDISRALDESGGNVSRAARSLSLSSRYALYRLMKQYGLSRSSE